MKCDKRYAVYLVYSMLFYSVFCLSHVAYSQLASKARDEFLTIERLRLLCIQQATSKNVVDLRIVSHSSNEFLLLNASQASEAIDLMDKVAQAADAKIILVDDTARTLQHKSYQEELLSRIDNEQGNHKPVIVLLYNLHEKAVGDIEKQISFLLKHYAYSRKVCIVAHTPLVRVYVYVNYDNKIKPSVAVASDILILEEICKDIMMLGLIGYGVGALTAKIIKALRKNRAEVSEKTVVICVVDQKKILQV